MSFILLWTARCVTLLLFIAASSHSHAANISALFSSDQPRYRDAHRSFVKSLAAHGYASPSSEITIHASAGDPASVNADLKKISNSRPDIIVTYGTQAAIAAARDTDLPPVISVDVYAAEQTAKGLCGVSSRVQIVTLLKTMLAIRPVSRLGVLVTPKDFGSQQQLEDIKKNAGKLGITIIEGNAATQGALDSELARLFDRSDAVLVTESWLFGQNFERITARAKNRKIPIISTIPDAADKGALVSMEVSPQEQGYLAAEIAARVLEGAKTEYLRLVRPQRVDLVINMRLSKEIGLNIPGSVARGASRLIK